MPKKAITILISLFLSMVVSGYCQTDTTSFVSKVNNFLDSKSSDYIIIYQNKYDDGNKFTDEKAKPSWKKTITLKSRISFINKYNQTVYPRIYLSFYQFKDSVKCRRAKANILKCMGGDCTEVKWGDKDASVKSPPFIYVFSSNKIIACHIWYEHVNKDWETLKKEIVDKLGGPNAKTMEKPATSPKLIFSK